MTGVLYFIAIICLGCGMMVLIGKGVSRKVFYSREDLIRSIQDRTE